jgi:hypothetical protein
MTTGIVYFIRNNTGVKLCYTSTISLSEAIRNNNGPNIADPFILVSKKHAKIVKNPKKNKKILCDKMNKYHINRDMYNITDKQIILLLNKIKGKNSNNILNLLPNEYNNSDSDYETENYDSGYETEDNDSNYETENDDSGYETDDNDSDSDYETANDNSEYETDDNGSDEYEVDNIISHKGNSIRNIRFRIRWKGYTENDDTYEPIGNLHNCKELLYSYIIDKGNFSEEIIQYISSIKDD